MPIEIKNVFGHLLIAVDKETLSGADLSGADLSRANLSRADLSGADLSFSSHDLLAEIIRRAAGDDLDRLQAAGLILIQRHWCWTDFLAIEHPQKTWVINTLRAWVRDGDAAPQCLRLPMTMTDSTEEA